MSVPLDDLPNSSADMARRDQYGRYLIVPPHGGPPVGYTRATTVAGTLDSGGGLAPWKATMAVCGAFLRRGLRARWEALLAEDRNPWYASKELKAKCKELVEESAAAGGAEDRRDQGTAMHTISALLDLGKAPTVLTEEVDRDIEAYKAGMKEQQVWVVDGYVEVTVVLDSWQVAGTFDRLVTIPGFDLPLIADLKTGADLTYSWHSIAVQLAIYAHADDCYQQGSDKDGSKDQRKPMPPVDQKWGLVIWLPADTGKLEFHLVDLELGWEAFETSIWTWAWRNRKDVSIELSELTHDVEPGDELADLLEGSLPHEVQIRVWLQDRINAIGEHPEARHHLRQWWPEGLPSLRAHDGHSAAQLAVIEQLLNDTERAYALSFPAERPGPTEPVERVLSLLTNPEEKP